jgi:ABC-type glutathione transport system ATPase component
MSCINTLVATTGVHSQRNIAARLARQLYSSDLSGNGQFPDFVPVDDGDVLGRGSPLLLSERATGEQRALADISFTVNAGEILGLIGPNGAGKTTLLEAIA